MTIRMKSLKAHTFSGKRYQVGDPFYVPGESLKRVLIAIKVAEVVPEPVAAPVEPPEASPIRRGRPRATPIDQAIHAESSPVDASAVAQQAADLSAPPAAPAKRAYRRRDLTAE